MKQWLLCLLMFSSMKSMEHPVPSLKALAALAVPQSLKWNKYHPDQVDNAISILPIEVSEFLSETLANNPFSKAEKLPFMNIESIDAQGSFGLAAQEIGNSKCFLVSIVNLETTHYEKLVLQNLHDIFLSPDNRHIVCLLSKDVSNINHNVIQIIDRNTQKCALEFYIKNLRRLYYIENSPWFGLQSTAKENYYFTVEELLKTYQDQQRPIACKDLNKVRWIPPTAVRHNTVKDFFISDLITWLETYPTEGYKTLSKLEDILKKQSYKKLAVHPSGNFLAACKKKNNESTELTLWDTTTGDQISMVSFAGLPETDKIQWINQGDELLVFGTDRTLWQIARHNVEWAKVLKEKIDKKNKELFEQNSKTEKL